MACRGVRHQQWLGMPKPAKTVFWTCELLVRSHPSPIFNRIPSHVELGQLISQFLQSHSYFECTFLSCMRQYVPEIDVQGHAGGGILITAIFRNFLQFSAIFPNFSESHINLRRSSWGSEIDNLQPKNPCVGYQSDQNLICDPRNVVLKKICNTPFLGF